MENPDAIEKSDKPEPTGAYTRIEREHFDTILGPGSAVAIESIRKITGMRLKISRGGVRHPEVD